MTDPVPVDDAAVIAELADMVIGMLESRNSDLEARNRDLDERNAELSAQVADLTERMAALERKLTRNSGNSGVPPSSDDIPGRTAPAPRPGRGNGKRKPGKQEGAPGADLAWSDDPDDRKDLFPRGRCGCGGDLKDAADLGVAASHQLIDTPEVTATLTQYDEHLVQCRCGRRHAAAPPPGEAGDSTRPYSVEVTHDRPPVRLEPQPDARAPRGLAYP